MTAYEQLKQTLPSAPRRWLVTGVAGFIGSHLLETLLKLNQTVVGLDNFATGSQRNLDEVRDLVGTSAWQRFEFKKGHMADPQKCHEACRDIDIVLHQAALGSVPRSLEDPLGSFGSNVTGFLHLITAARDNRVSRFVYASSSSVYGDHPALPKQEERIGLPLSPYAATKFVDEIIAGVWGRCYGTQSIGLRYFNVFGPRQDPEGPYAAVIPKWIAALLAKEPVFINGDGESSRDFCYVENVVQANLLAGMTADAAAVNQVYNVALNARVTLNELFTTIRDQLAHSQPELGRQLPLHRGFRPGDVAHSQADISKARKLLGYQPTHTFAQGLEAALQWYVRSTPTQRGLPVATPSHA